MSHIWDTDLSRPPENLLGGRLVRVLRRLAVVSGGEDAERDDGVTSALRGSDAASARRGSSVMSAARTLAAPSLVNWREPRGRQRPGIAPTPQANRVPITGDLGERPRHTHPLVTDPEHVRRGLPGGEGYAGPQVPVMDGTEPPGPQSVCDSSSGQELVDIITAGRDRGAPERSAPVKEQVPVVVVHGGGRHLHPRFLVAGGAALESTVGR